MAPSNPPNVADLFAAVLRGLSDAKASHWFRIKETNRDTTTDWNRDRLQIRHLEIHDGGVEKAIEATSKQMNLLAKYSKDNLHRHAGLNHADFVETMKHCKLQNSKSFKKDALDTFLNLHNIDAEIEYAKPSGG